MNETTDAEIELIKGAGGVFDIRIDGDLAFSKKCEGRYPSDDEVRALLA